MITTKALLAEQIIRRLSGGDVSDDSEYDIREIIRLIEQTVALLVKANFFESLRIGETAIGPQYISSFRDVPIRFDESLDKSYLILPCNYIELPQDRGIYQISPVKEQGFAFVPVRNGSENLFSHSPANNLEGRIGFWPEGDRIYFKENIYREGCDKVLLKLVVSSPQNVQDDDSYPIGSDMELPIIEKVLQLMDGRIETDDVNDNSNKV